MKLRDMLMNRTGICSVEGEGEADAGGAGGGGGAGGAGGAGDGGAGAAAWYATLDADTQGVLQVKGWDKLDATQAAAQAIAAHREAERFLGVPKDQLVRKPDPADPASAAAFWQQFGKPATTDGYDFSSVKFGDGTALDDNFVAHMRDTADSLNLPADVATQVVANVVKFMEQADTAEAGERAAAVATQQEALKKEWATNYDAHKFIAKQGALKVGVSEQEFDALFETPGGAKMLEIFRKIGDMSGEGRFVQQGGGGGNGGPMTREQALATKNSLMADEAWVTRYNNGDAQALAQMTGLNTILTAGTTEADFFG
jgi:hypothetical protein